MERKCKSCNSPLGNNRFFCPVCGEMLDLGKNAGNKNGDDIQFKMKRVRSNLAEFPHTSVYWDDTIDAYVKKMEKFKAVLALEELKSKTANELPNKINKFINDCRNPEFQIAFVGTIKTGKSTLINALLGNNYASTDVNPETAALTKFRSSDKDYVQVTFYSEKEWSKFWKQAQASKGTFMENYNALNAESCKSKWVGHETYRIELPNSEVEDELTKWSSSKHAEHYFVKEIEVGISTLPHDMPKQVVFVDTPGLSDPVPYRSEITKKYIRSANAVFVCIRLGSFQDNELNTIETVLSISSQRKETVYIIGTQWDKIDDVDRNWIQLKNNIAKEITGPAFFDSYDIADKHIIYTAAKIYNLCRDYANLNNKEKTPLKQFALGLDLDYDDLESIIPQLKEKSNIDNLRMLMSEKLIANYSVFLKKELIENYKFIETDILKFAHESKTHTDSIIAASNESLEELKKRLNEQMEKNRKIEQDREQLEAVLAEVTKRSQKHLNEITAALDKAINS